MKISQAIHLTVFNSIIKYLLVRTWFYFSRNKHLKCLKSNVLSFSFSTSMLSFFLRVLDRILRKSVHSQRKKEMYGYVIRFDYALFICRWVAFGLTLCVCKVLWTHRSTFLHWYERVKLLLFVLQMKISSVVNWLFQVRRPSPVVVARRSRNGLTRHKKMAWPKSTEIDVIVVHAAKIKKLECYIYIIHIYRNGKRVSSREKV